MHVATHFIPTSNDGTLLSGILFMYITFFPLQICNENLFILFYLIGSDFFFMFQTEA